MIGKNILLTLTTAQDTLNTYVSSISTYSKNFEGLWIAMSVLFFCFTGFAYIVYKQNKEDAQKNQGK